MNTVDLIRSIHQLSDAFIEYLKTNHRPGEVIPLKRKPTLGASLVELNMQRRGGLSFGTMNGLAQRDKDPDSCFWKRDGFPPSIEWVCLTNPLGKLQRHYVAKVSNGYVVWMPTMEDLMANDWRRV